MNGILRFPNTEKELKLKELISKNDEKFIELNFYEDDELKFDIIMNKAQFDYFVDFCNVSFE